MLVKIMSIFSVIVSVLAAPENLNLTASSITRDQIMQRAQVWVEETCKKSAPKFLKLI